jgi:hypothetical protein
MGVVKSKLRFKLLILVALLAGATAPASAAEPQPKPARIDRNGVLILVRSTLIALDQANTTGNYTVLRDLGSPAFQANSAARLGEIFAGLRHESLDLSGVAVLDPELTLLPQIDADGMMRMTGFFPSAPAQINFDLVYAPVNGQWRLFAITVGLGQTAPVAPAPPAPAEKPAPPEKKKHQKE